MARVVFSIFIVLHGLVHLLYFGQSTRLFELQPGMTWPDGSWLFSIFLKEEAIRSLAGVLCILAAAGFVVGGAALLAKQTWWDMVVVAVAIFSSMLYILSWDGKLQELDDKGGIAILINVALLVSLLAFHWPNFEF